jgi:hypothetical protein
MFLSFVKLHYLYANTNTFQTMIYTTFLTVYCTRVATFETSIWLGTLLSDKELVNNPAAKPIAGP